MNANRKACLRWWTLALVVAVAACGGGGGNDAGPSPEQPPSRIGRGWIQISSPTEGSGYSTQSAQIRVSGTAFLDGDGYRCCSGSASDTGVWVGWENGTSASGSASQSVEYCQFYFGTPYLCRHTWSAWIPLALGENLISVFAYDSGNNKGHDWINVTRLPDTTPPRVMSTRPADGATGIGTSSAFEVTFSEEMDPASVSSAIVLSDGLNNPVAGHVTYADRIATFRPVANLEGLTTYTATVTTGARDVEGNALAEQRVSSFSTGVADDIWPPTVSSTSPASGASCVPTDTRLSAVFDEPMSATSLAPGNFMLRDGTHGIVGGTASFDLQGIAHFYPSNRLEHSSTYTATITTGLTDLAGNRLATDYHWTFTTEPMGTGAWFAIPTAGAASPRTAHTVVWTGTEMIVWGGYRRFYEKLGDGVRYDPASDTWVRVAASGAPEARWGHVAVWTGRTMIVWGGQTYYDFLSSGAIYDPATDSWTSMSTIGSPSGRADAAAVWTGTEMIVWGGQTASGVKLVDGAKYNPATNAWTPISAIGAPSGRVGQSALWSGSAMLVWGGWTTTPAGLKPSNDGASYSPLSDAWTPIPLAGSPAARVGHSAVWTGAEMIIWGGSDGGANGKALDTGARYHPDSNMWQPIDTRCAPSPRQSHVAVWTGAEMIVWGGGESQQAHRRSGGRYKPITDSWQPIQSDGAPSAWAAAGIWTGTEMIVWGGQDAHFEVVNTGGKLRP